MYPFRCSSVNFFFGNQIWGIKPLEKPVEPLVILQNILYSTAKIHAKYWNAKRLLKTNWLKPVDWYKGQNKPKWLMGMKRAQKQYGKELKKQKCQTTI
jgi:hypothetical protein